MKTWVCYGGGTDSTAMIIEMVKRGETIDLITFADTGAELPHTYEAVKRMNEWLLARGYCGVTIVRYSTREGIHETLEQSIVKNKNLPSLAFGFHTCSIRFKIDPQVKFAKKFQPFLDVWANGEKVVRCIGYDASPADSKRANRSTTNFPDLDIFSNRYPLREWGLDRTACEAIILAAGLPAVGKSACYFCPARKKHELLDMIENNPEYFEKALAIEDAAIKSGKLRAYDPAFEKFTRSGKRKGTVGLGRNFKWSEIKKGEV